jgi:hypothetical protein
LIDSHLQARELVPVDTRSNPSQHDAEGRAVVIQHPKSDGGAEVVTAPAPLLIKVAGSVMTVGAIVVFPTHGDSEGTFGVGTTICELRPDPPASVAADGIVASLYDGPVIVVRPGIGLTAVLLKNSVRFWALIAGLQAPFMIDGAK